MSNAERLEFFNVEQYLSREELAQTKNEYVDGWIRAMTGLTLRHNQVAGNCYFRLRNFLQGKRCQPFNSDTRVRIDQNDKKRFYFPDVQVVCESNEPGSLFQDRPVLIIEVLSPSTRRYDLDEKMTAYLAIPGIECYLVLEQHQPQAIVMRKTNAGFLREDIGGLLASIDLPFLGCSLSMADIYEGIEFTSECVQESELEYEMG